MSKFGTITFQANNSADIFQKVDVFEDGQDVSDETLLNVSDPQFDSGNGWVTGRVPKMKPVSIDGDTTIVNALLRVTEYEYPFVVTIYVECEMTEELIGVESDEKNEEDEDTSLAPVEINL